MLESTDGSRLRAILDVSILFLLISAGKKKCLKSDQESIPETMKMTSDMTSRRSDNEEDSEVHELSSLVISVIPYARPSF